MSAAHTPLARTRTALVIAAMMGAVTIAILAAQGCRSAPVSGRKQLVLIPESQEIQLGVQAYEQTLSSEPISENTDVAEMVERVGQRIAAVANKPEYDWEFKVIAKDVQNAFALPGGKVAVYEGILPVCQSEAGLAVVMSHEIAHAIARHGGERMSQQAAVQGVGSVINAVSQKKADDATTEKIMQVYGVSSRYGVILPYSRKHESEADAIGLILMAKAGYDPSVAPEFWERFSKASGQKPPEFLSTHPADARRAADLRALLPEAMKYYNAAQQQIGMGDPIPVHAIAATPAAPVEEPPTPIQQKTGVRQASARLPFGSVSALTGRSTTKKRSVEHAVHEELAGVLDAADIQPAAAQFGNDESESSAISNADFHLPVKEEVNVEEQPSGLPVIDIDPNGWSATEGE